MRREFQAHLLVLLATLLVAGSFVASERLAGIINPFSLTLLRFLSAAVILLPVVLWKRRWRRKIVPTLPRALIMSLFYAVFFIGMFEALNTTSALNTGAIYTLVPLVTALLSIFIFREKVSKRQMSIYLLGALGATWVIFNGDIDLLLSATLSHGDMIFSFAAFSMCCYAIAMKRLYRNDEMVVLVFCTLVGGSFWMVLSLLIFKQALQWELIQSDLMLSMAYLVIAATLTTAYLYQKTTVILGPSRVNSYIFLIPALVAIFLLFIDGVSMSMSILPGILISTAATIALQLNYKKERLQM